jgi:hypothetical protein
MPASEIYGRAENYRKRFWEQRLDKKKKQLVRDRPCQWAEQMLVASNEDELRKALDTAPNYVQGEFNPFLALILSIFREKTFPKSKTAQLDYLADSLAGLGQVTPRSSRDICGIEKAKARRASRFRIIRYEYYIECTCRYKGPARDGACRKCGAEIPILERIAWGSGFV